MYLNESPDATPEFLVYTDPNFEDQATPTLSNSVFVTNLGEVVQEEATPSVLRFVDLTSRIDIRSFRGAFTNSLNGLEQVNFSLNIYESDSRNGPWLFSTTTSSMAIGSLLLARNAKRYAKFEVVIDTELTNLSVLNFALLVEISIAEPNSPVLSRAAKNVLKKFPSWTEINRDSEDRDDELIFSPQSVGGKLVQSILNDNLDYFESQIDSHNINKFIGSADINQASWIYSSYDVPNTFNKILGNGIELTKVSEILSLYDANPEEYIYYHNPVNRQIITLRKFDTLVAYSVNSSGSVLSQIPYHRFNWFDEFGARVGLNRLYLEDNLSFRFRILDVFKNRSSTTIDGFKNSVRRELNLWKAFGATPNAATPDLYYDLAATPEILEMEDIEYSSEYFNFDGSPKEKFKNLVKYLNERYPTTWGYFRFDDAVWDTAGFEQNGVDRIKSSYQDELDSFALYQSGVGDFSDAKVFVQNNSATPEYFESIIYANGKRKTGTTDYYSPIKVEYEYSGNYNQTVYNNQAATVNLTLEAVMLPYQNYTTNTNVYATFSQFVRNEYGPTSSASPEFYSIPLFDTEGFTSDEIIFKNKTTGAPITFTSANSSSYTKIPFNKLSSVQLKNGYWNGTTYATPNSNDFKAFFSHHSTPLTSSTSFISGSTPSFDESLQIKIVSNKYNTEVVNLETRKTRSSFVINEYLENATSNYSMPIREIERSIIYPYGSTPTHVNIYGIVPTDGLNVPGFYEEETIDIYGGISYDFERDLDVFVPSSPNIVATVYGGGSGTFGFIDSLNGGATKNYYFGKINYSMSSTPNSIVVKSVDGQIYPFKEISWEPFELEASPHLSGYVDEYGYVSYNNANADRIPGFNSNIIPTFNLSRESFGLDGQNKFDYFFESINATDPANVNVSIWADQNIVKPFLNKSYLIEDSVEDALNNENGHQLSLDYPYDSIVEQYDEENNTSTFTGLTVRGKLYDYKIDGKIKTGWIDISEDGQYIYARPVEEVFTGNLKKITLSQNPQQGAPIILEIKDQDATPVNSYREIIFSDSATPDRPSFYNTELIMPKKNNSFYLGYKNFYDLSIKDTYTGETLVTKAASPEYIMSVNESAKKLETNRTYEIIYKLKDSYYIDTELVNDDYVTSIYFDSTPGQNFNYKVIYESSSYESSTPVSVDFNPFTSSIDSGYVVISKDEYDFSKLETVISPNYLINDGQDYADISIMSIDVNGNRKPYQSFEVSSDSLELSENLITTDSEGYAHITARCPGEVSIFSQTFDGITFTGVNRNENANAHPNSSSSGYTVSFDIEIIPAQQNNPLTIIAEPSARLIQADGVSTVYVDGVVLLGNIRLPETVVYWRKARYLYDIFNEVPYTYGSSLTVTSDSGSVITDENGRFSIGPFVARDNNEPGIWFVAVETEGPLPNPENPETIAGDVVYWMEDFDSVNYNIDDTVTIQDVVNYNSEKSMDLYSTPTFRLSYYGSQRVEVNPQNPAWNPPSWYSVNRYQQYQSGLFGSTPYYIEDYNAVRNDILRP